MEQVGGSRAAVLTHLKTLGALFYVSVIPGFVQLNTLVPLGPLSSEAILAHWRYRLGVYKLFPQPSEPHRLPV